LLTRGPYAPAPMRLNPIIPEELEHIISKCPEGERGLRYQHALEIRTDLKRLQREFALRGAGTEGWEVYTRHDELVVNPKRRV